MMKNPIWSGGRKAATVTIIINNNKIFWDWACI